MKTTQHVTDVRSEVALDQVRTAFYLNIANYFLKSLSSEEHLPPGTNRNVLRQTTEQIERCIREIKRTTADHYMTYLDRNMAKDKREDMATAIACIARIGVEEKEEVYEEFFGLLIDAIDATFYSQDNRKRVQFGKYKALFAMIAEEIRADVNGEPGQIHFIAPRQIFFRSLRPDSITQMK